MKPPGLTPKEWIERVYTNTRDGVRIFLINLALRFIRRIDYEERRLHITIQWDDDEYGDTRTISEFIDDDWKYLIDYHIKNLV